MADKQCAVCKRMVADADQEEHLRLQHLGPHYFWFNARGYRTDKPSMLARYLMKMMDAPSDRHLIEDRNGETISYADGQSVDMTQQPQFFWSIPATL